MWGWLVPQLDRMGILQKIDGPLLARYCQTWAKWKKAAQFLDQYNDTYVIKDAQGQPRIFMPFPQLSSFTKLSNSLSRMEQELGMSPSSRSRIHVEPGRAHESPGLARLREFNRDAGPKPPRLPPGPSGEDFFDGGGPDQPVTTEDHWGPRPPPLPIGQFPPGAIHKGNYPGGLPTFRKTRKKT